MRIFIKWITVARVNKRKYEIKKIAEKNDK